MMKWMLQQETANIELMAQTLSISRTMAQVLVNRGIRTRNTALRFLNPALSDMHDPREMKGMEEALDIVAASIGGREKIVVYGDYDADGVMSTVILYKTLRRLGADVVYYIPERVEEGYGLNMTAVRGIAESGVDLIITSDNGIAANAEIAAAKELGLKVVVIDHHEPAFAEDADGVRRDIAPPADAIVDPKQAGCAYPFKALCAGGLAYKFSKALHERLGESFEDASGFAEEMLSLAMIATICDIVDLHGENRVIARAGLAALNRVKTRNIGLGALIDAKGYTHRLIDATAVGFIIGPCINASGRLEHARYAVDLFTTENAEEARELAGWLVSLNESRRALTLTAFESAAAKLEQDGLTGDNVLVVYDPSIHESVAGIVAGRIKDRYYKPTIVITDSEGCLKGSARSIEGYNIFEELYKCRELFLRFGGHAMAAGLSIEPGKLGELRSRLNADFALGADELVPKLTYDDRLEVHDITYELAQELAKLEPFGKANRAPLFCSLRQSLRELRVIEGKNTVIVNVSPGGSYRRVKGISFNMVPVMRQILSERLTPEQTDAIMSGETRRTDLLFDLLYELEIDEYNGNVSVQMRIKDMKLSS
ncbi:MAG: single-stranded-DNA-specific exonuclease RecJ [Defluviitaleaceae bacterium]|nr:single-stranded-DNA-specific exonuclease RecJ [Defluviitaleaceae bacterium]